MQKLRNLALDVQSVHESMSSTFKTYQDNKQLFCRPGCGQCCLNPDIRVTALELLPLAMHLYDNGTIVPILNELERYHQDACFFYSHEASNPGKGFCDIYSHRPTICRMFGAAGHPDKHGQARLSVCKIIQEDHPEALAAAKSTKDIDSPPIMKHWKSQLTQLDYEFGKTEMPINEAFIQTFTKVLMTSYYQNCEIEAPLKAS